MTRKVGSWRKGREVVKVGGQETLSTESDSGSQDLRSHGPERGDQIILS